MNLGVYTNKIRDQLVKTILDLKSDKFPGCQIYIYVQINLLDKLPDKANNAAAVKNVLTDAIQSKMKEASILAKANSNSSKLDQEKNLFELQKRNLTKDLANMEENKQKSEQMHDRLKFLKNVT